MTRRTSWGYEETRAMLNTMIKNSYLAPSECKIHQKNEIFKKIRKDLRLLGFNTKDEVQIKIRWKNLRHKYGAAKKKNEKCLFYDQLDVLLNDNVTNISYLTEAPKSEYRVVLENVPFDVMLPDVMDSNSRIETTLSEIDLPSKVVAKLPKMNSIAKSPKKEKFGKGSYARNIEKLGFIIKKTLDDANQDFFETQKELIDHEIEAFIQKEAELDERFNMSIKNILEDNTSQFLDGLKDIFDSIEESD